MNTPLSCTKCHHDAPEYEVKLCTQCLDRAICCDCASPVHAELEVCSDECAVDAILKLKAARYAPSRKTTRREWTPIDETTAGPLVPYCDDRKVA